MIALRVRINPDDVESDPQRTELLAEGSAYCSGNLLRGRALAQVFDQLSSPEEVRQTLLTLNGFYAIVLLRDGTLCAAVDRVRSIPLFYAVSPTDFFLSDDPQWIVKMLGYNSLCPLSVAEFLLAGYVTGSETLVTEVRQVQAGEMLVVRFQSGAARLEGIRYYEFEHGNYSDSSEEWLLSRLEEVSMSSIQRLVRYADGRQIAIPLSGGLDSRLIAMLLKRSGYDNVIAFSYGQRGNEESRVSQFIADQLGITWRFVEYTPEKWKQWYRSKDYQRYIDFGGRISSVAHCQDWPAMMNLRTERSLDDDAVVVPGHSADFVAGSHIPPRARSMVSVSNMTGVVAEIWKTHYSVNTLEIAAARSELAPIEIRTNLSCKIDRLLTGRSAEELSLAVDALEFWDWQERQAKYIVNSVRVYEFWGYDWWLPWWDAEFMDFWQRVPVQLRMGKVLYDGYVQGVQRDLAIHGRSLYQKGASSAMKMLLKRAPFRVREAYTLCSYALNWRRIAKGHPMAWYGIVPPHRMTTLRRRSANVVTFLALDQIEGLRMRGLINDSIE